MKYLLTLSVLFVFACAPQQEQPVDSQTFSRRYVQPTNGYAQMVVIERDGVKTLQISGQVGEGDNLETQMRDVLQKLKVLLESEGLLLLCTRLIDPTVEVGKPHS